MATKYGFLNDSIIPDEELVIHYTDLSIQRGIGIFDFLAIEEFEPLYIEDHLDRFTRSAKEMRLSLNYSREELRMIIHDLVRRNVLSHGGIRMTLTGGYSADGYNIQQPNLIISTHQFQLPSNELFESGIKLMTWEHQRQMPHVKTTDYLMAVWLQPILKEKSADDILYTNNGLITECPRANIFIVTQENKLVTPANNILHGVIRKQVIELANNLEVEQRDISITELHAAREVFITSTTKRILPVARVDQHSYSTPGEITIQLYQKLQRKIHHPVEE